LIPIKNDVMQRIARWWSRKIWGLYYWNLNRSSYPLSPYFLLLDYYQGFERIGSCHYLPSTFTRERNTWD